MLNRFTRPSFLQWLDDPKGMTRYLFGHVLSDHVENTMKCMGLEHAGFVARPLYACTNHIGGRKMCMKVASMSRYIELGDERGHYRCRECREKESTASAPVSDSAPLRVLDMYMLVRDGAKNTIMRSRAYKLCLCAPPSYWAWNVEMMRPSNLHQAQPDQNGRFYEYSERDSEQIWCYSCSYEGKPQ